MLGGVGHSTTHSASPCYIASPACNKLRSRLRRNPTLDVVAFRKLALGLLPCDNSPRHLANDEIRNGLFRDRGDVHTVRLAHCDHSTPFVVGLSLVISFGGQALPVEDERCVGSVTTLWFMLRLETKTTRGSAGLSHFGLDAQELDFQALLEDFEIRGGFEV